MADLPHPSVDRGPAGKTIRCTSDVGKTDLESNFNSSTRVIRGVLRVTCDPTTSKCN